MSMLGILHLMDKQVAEREVLLRQSYAFNVRDFWRFGKLSSDHLPILLGVAQVTDRKKFKFAKDFGPKLLE